MRQTAVKPFALANGLLAMHYEVVPTRWAAAQVTRFLSALAIDLDAPPCAQQLTNVC